MQTSLQKLPLLAEAHQLQTHGNWPSISETCLRKAKPQRGQGTGTSSSHDRSQPPTPSPTPQLLHTCEGAPPGPPLPQVSGPAQLTAHSGQLQASRSREAVTVKLQNYRRWAPSEQGPSSLLSRAPVLVTPHSWGLNKGRTAVGPPFPAMCSEINCQTTRITVRTGTPFPDSQTRQQMVKTCSCNPSRKAPNL